MGLCMCIMTKSLFENWFVETWQKFGDIVIAYDDAERLMENQCIWRLKLN